MVADSLLHTAAKQSHLRGSAGKFKKHLCDRAPLSTVTAQQWLSLADAARHQRQLPGEIECVLHARVHPLTTRRAVDMRSIACNKDAAGTVVLNLALVDAEVRPPHGISNLDPPRAALIENALDLFDRRIRTVPFPDRAGRLPTFAMMRYLV